MKTVFHIIKLEGCDCGHPDCDNINLSWASDSNVSGWTESLKHAKEYTTRESALLAVDDLCTFHQRNKKRILFRIDELFRS